jgi:hypothetical protein
MTTPQRSRYTCIACNTPYGAVGVSKPKPGYCAYCWDVHLRQQQLNTAQAQRDWNVSKNHANEQR